MYSVHPRGKAFKKWGEADSKKAELFCYAINESKKERVKEEVKVIEKQTSLSQKAFQGARKCKYTLT
jgi:hypothetical protein